MAMELGEENISGNAVLHIDKVHFVVSDINGKQIFDSHDFEKKLFLRIYDQEENLLYSWEVSYDNEKVGHTIDNVSDENESDKKIPYNNSALGRTQTFEEKRRQVLNSNAETEKMKDKEDHVRDRCFVLYEETNSVALKIKTIGTRSTETQMATQQKGKPKQDSNFTSSDHINHKNIMKANDRPTTIKNKYIQNDFREGDGFVHQTETSEDPENTELDVVVNNKKRPVHSSPRSKKLKLKRTKLLPDPVQCNICGVQYKSQVMLEKHKSVHETEKTDLENPLQCAVCKKTYPTWRSLTVHKRKHDASKNNVCDKCGKSFRTKQELTRHDYVHSSEKSSPCHVCGKLFKNKAYAMMHSKLHSEENRKHQCSICGKYFLRGPDIQKHMRIHTGEKPYICASCGKSFSESSHLIRHERLHSGDKPYECETCHQRFTHKEALARHSFTHMEHLPYSCEVCKKGFITKRELDNHWLVHDKPSDPAQKEICQLCGKAFSHGLYLRYHMRHHKNIGRYQCHICYKIFKKPLMLENHVTSEHPGSEPRQRNEHSYSVWNIEPSTSEV